MYLQLFFTVYQYDIVRHSSKYIMMKNGEDSFSFQSYAKECMWSFIRCLKCSRHYLLNPRLVNKMVLILFTSCKRNILYDVFNSALFYVNSLAALFILDQLFCFIRGQPTGYDHHRFSLDFYTTMYKVASSSCPHAQTKEVRCLIELQNANIDPSKTLILNPAMANLICRHGPPRNHNPAKVIVQDIKRSSGVGELVNVIHPPVGAEPGPWAQRACGEVQSPSHSLEASHSPQNASNNPHNSNPQHPNNPHNTANNPQHAPEETTEPLSLREESQPSRLLLKRQSSALLLDAQDMDKVVKEEVVLQSNDGSLFSVQTASEPSLPHSDSESSTDLSQASTLSTSSSTSRRLHHLHSNSHAPHRNLPQNLIQIVSLHSQPLFHNEGYFTLYQAMEYLIQKSPRFPPP